MLPIAPCRLGRGGKPTLPIVQALIVHKILAARCGAYDAPQTSSWTTELAGGHLLAIMTPRLGRGGPPQIPPASIVQALIVHTLLASLASRRPPCPLSIPLTFRNAVDSDGPILAFRPPVPILPSRPTKLLPV